MHDASGSYFYLDLTAENCIAVKPSVLVRIALSEHLYLTLDPALSASIVDTIAAYPSWS